MSRPWLVLPCMAALFASACGTDSLGPIGVGSSGTHAPGNPTSPSGPASPDGSDDAADPTSDDPADPASDDPAAEDPAEPAGGDPWVPGGDAPFGPGGVPPASPPVCASTVVEPEFAHSVCACGNVDVSGAITVLPNVAGQIGGVGVNGTLKGAGSCSINTSVIAAGGLHVSGGVDVSGSILSNESVSVIGALYVGHDLMVGGNLSTSGLSVGGRLGVAGGMTTLGSADVGQRVAYAGDVPPPCACDSSSVLDIAALVAEAEHDNDNATIGLTEAALGIVQLPTGRYHITGAAQLKDAHIVATGNVDLFIAGDLSGTDWFNHIHVRSGAQLDVYIAGNITTLGDVDVDAGGAKLRVFIGGRGATVQYLGGINFRGSLYAPGLRVSVMGAMTTTGSLFVDSLNIVGPLSIGSPGVICE